VVLIEFILVGADLTCRSENNIKSKIKGRVCQCYIDLSWAE